MLVQTEGAPRSVPWLRSCAGRSSRWRPAAVRRGEEIVQMGRELEDMLHDWWIDLDSLRVTDSGVRLDGIFEYQRRRFSTHLEICQARLISLTDTDETAQLLVAEVREAAEHLDLVSLGPRSTIRFRVESEWSYRAFMDLRLAERR